VSDWKRCPECDLELRLDAGLWPEHWIITAESEFQVCPRSGAKRVAGPFAPFQGEPAVWVQPPCSGGCGPDCRHGRMYERVLSHVPKVDDSDKRWRPFPDRP
jgi:hypothetical protein